MYVYIMYKNSSSLINIQIEGIDFVGFIYIHIGVFLTIFL